MKMYSGSDSTESQNYTQWALNPTAYQNVSGENVDWAALAQQWIIMKEAGPPVPEQAAPSAIMNKLRKDNLNEGGEAPMDVENEKEDDQPEAPWGENVAVAGGDNWNWNQQSQWGWSNTWAPAGVPPPNTIKPPLLPTPAYNQYSTVPDVPSENTNFGGYSSVSQNDYTSGYWTAAGSSKMKQHNKRYSKVNVPRPPPTPEPIALDAAKRKQLPAWIREGLEKMERDKQRQLEKEREKQEKEEQDDKVKLSEKDALDIIKSTVKEQQRGKFESDEDDYSDEEKNTKNTYVAEPTPLTQEELMLKVRRTMTEILLNVTNREIRSVCKEELQRYVKKMKASDDRVSAPSGANLSAKLGLGMYGDSGSSGDESEEEPQQEFHDSDAELKDLIRKKKAEFSKTEREIEDRLAEAEGHTGDDSRPATPEVTDNDTQVDAKTQGRSKVRFNNSNNEHTPPPKQVQLKRKSYKSSSSSSQSDTDSEKKSSRSYKSKRRHRSDSSNSRRSRSSSSEYKKSKHRDEVHGSKSGSSQSRRSRSKSLRNRRSRSRSKSYRRSRYSRRSRSRSHSRRSNSRSRRSSSRSHYKPSRSRRSRSRSRSYSRSHKRSRSRRRSNSSHRSHRKRRSVSSGSTRGKRSHRN